LKDRDWSHPLEKLDRKFDEHFDDSTAEKFHMARSNFLNEWCFLEILWGRLQNSQKILYESNLQIKEGTVKNFKHNMMVGRLLKHSLDDIFLDSNCFILNARILMDGTAYLTSFLWRKITKERPCFGSFNQHKRWFCKPQNKNKIIDKEYASYLLLNTDWFNNKLKKSRDELIVHRFRSSDSYYVDAFRLDSGTVLKANALFKDFDGNKAVEYDTRQIPDLNELMDNICGFLSFFDEHFSQTL